jgi:hypothetical protein
LEVFVRKKWVVLQTVGLFFSFSLMASFFASPARAQDGNFFDDGTGERVEFKAEPSALQKDGSSLFIQLGKNTYTVVDRTDDAASLERFNAMPPEKQARFIQNRDLFIVNAAKILRRVGWTFGVGSLVGGKIVMVKDKLIGSDEKEAANIVKAREGFRSRTDRIINSILAAMNRQLWSQAPLVGDANEFGVTMSLGLAAEGGRPQKGWGGQFEIGVSFGYNKEKKAFVFQIYRNIEKFKSTLMPAVFFAGVTPKASIQVAQARDGAIQARLGSTIYPPGVPAFLSTTPTMFSSGFNSGIGFPPPPFGDMLSYTNRLDNKVLLRLMISPTLKGFVRVQFGIGLESFKVFLQPITAVKSWLDRRFGGGLCRGVFVN